MNIKICEDKILWNGWFLEQEKNEFLQSWEWGEFQVTVGNRPVRLQILEGDEVAGQLQGFEQKIFGPLKFIYFPRITNYQLSITNYLKKNYIFARAEPLEEVGDLNNIEMIKTNNRQPQDTFVLDIEKREEYLLSDMHSKTRYNISLAERKGVKIKQEKNIDIFWKLNEETTGRDKFKSHNKEYYTKMLQMENCYQLTACFEKEPIASIILIHFGNTLTYLHGTSGNKHRNLMAPYLLQWEGIRIAKKLGAKFYDFGGVSPSCSMEHETCNIKNITQFHNYSWDVAHKWTGITRFKVGFGGEPRHYPDAVEIVFKTKLYKLFQLAKKFL